MQRAGASIAPESILAQLKAQLAHFKVPKRCVVVPELPRTAMGKVQKNVLRGRYARGGIDDKALIRSRG